MAFFGKASIIEGCPYDPIGAQLRFHQSKEQIMSRFRLVLCVGMLIVLIGWLQDALAQGTQPSEAASRPFVWPPSDIVPHNLAVSTFGARPPFPRGMQQGTVSLRPEKLDQQAIDMLHAGGFRYANIWIEWSRVEQQKGRYDFSLYERYVARLQTKGLRPIFTFCFGNFLYCEGKPTNLTECICDDPLNTEQQRVAFANFAAAAAKHFTFKSTGAIFELWNEPNLEFFWMGKPNPAEFTAFAIRAADAMHHADPNAVVVGPGSSRGITDFVEKVFQLGILNHIDGVSHHFYTGLPPEANSSSIMTLRELVDRYQPKGKRLPIIDSESGYGSFGTARSEEIQAQYIVRRFLTHVLWGVDLSTWCTFIDQSEEHLCPNLDAGFGCMGTVTWDLKPKPGYRAVKALSEQLEGMRFVRRLDWGRDHGSDYALLFARVDEGNGFDYSHAKVVAWTTGDQSHMRLPLGAGGSSVDVKLWPGAQRVNGVEIVDMFGEKAETPVRITAGGERRINLSPSPIYIGFSI